MNLVLRSLWFCNFGSFVGEHSFRLDRPAGLYYVTGINQAEPALGANGVGKSTLWDALLWCLFGITIRDSVPAATVVPWSEGKATVTVRVKFQRNGKEHTVTRGRNPNKLLLDDEVVEQWELLKAIGVGDEVFRRTILLGQFGTLFLDLSPEKQSRLFTDILGLDVWLAAAKQAGLEADGFQASVLEKQVMAERLTGSLKEVDEQLTNAKEYEDSFEDRTDAQIKSQKVVIAMLKEELADHQKNEPKLPPGLDTSKKEMDAIETALAEIRIKRNKYVQAGATAKAQLKVLENEHDDLDDDVATYEKEIKGNKTCPECGQKVSVAHLEEKLVKLKQQMKESVQDQGNQTTLVENADKGIKSSDELITQREVALRDARAARERVTGARTVWSVKLAELEVDTAAAERERQRLIDLKNPHTQTVRDLKERFGTITTQLSEMKRSYETAQQQEERCRNWVIGFKEIRLGIIDETLAELEIATNRHAESLGLHGWEIRFLTEREKNSGAVVVRFYAEILPPGAQTAVRWERYSGGESQRWSLSASFGLSEVLLSRAGIIPNIEVLDEPTQHLSALGITDLIEHLKDRATDTNRAIYLVDHRALDVGSFDGIVMIKKDQDGSRIVEDKPPSRARPMTQTAPAMVSKRGN